MAAAGLPPELAMWSALEELDWMGRFSRRVLNRGLDYAAQDRVDDDWSVRDAGAFLELEGHVGGSSLLPYATRVRVAPEWSLVQSDCTCPFGHQCKHAVALIATFLDAALAGEDDLFANRSNVLFEHEWDAWLNRLAGMEQDEVRDTVDAERRLALFVNSLPQPPLPGICVALVWLRPARSGSRGRLVDPVAVDWTDDTLEPMPADGWPPELEERLALLLSGPQCTLPRRSLGWIQLSAPHQVRALRKLVEGPDALPVFLDRQTGPRLEPGPERSLRTHWIAQESGDQRLSGELVDEEGASPAEGLHLAGNALWYLDPESGRFGPVDGSVATAVSLLVAPPLPAERVAWAAERMQELPVLPQGIGPPVVPEVVELPPAAPVLVLRLGVLLLDRPQRPSTQDEFGCAMPGFDYDGLRLADEGEDRERVARGDTLVVVTRDRAAEQRLVDALPDGLVRFDMLTDRAGLPRPAEGASMRLLALGSELPSSLEAWPRTLAHPDDWWPLVERLRASGVIVEFEETFPAEPERVRPDDWHGTIEPAAGDWFDFALDVEVDGERIDLLPLLRALLEDDRLSLTPGPDEPEDATREVRLEDGRLLVLPLARLRSLVAPILDWLGEDAGTGPVRLPVSALADSGVVHEWGGEGRKRLGELARALAEVPARIPSPDGFHGSLRDYQAEGVAWLRRTSLLGVGGVLADDMGLGKTVQVLAHVLDERARRGLTEPVLVVCPTSLVANWCAEAERFCPGLRVLHLQRPKAERRRYLEELGGADLVVTTWALLVRDVDALREQHFPLVVLDEAQAIKNPRSKAAAAVRALDAERRLALTGTPLENHLGELWAQFDAVAPGLLGGADQFRKGFRKPVEDQGEREPLERLQRRIAPLLLRRTRDQVLQELPAKTETVRSVVLAGAQRELYESLRLAQHRRVRRAVEERGLARSGIVVLDALLKLRQACCDPRLVKLDSARRVPGSAKLAELRTLLSTLLDEGRRVLVFSQFTEMLALIETALDEDGIDHEILTGQVPGRDRKSRIERFQNGEAPVFLISLRAGGVGLNLTAADTVIHYDPWWNPAVEAQATGRAHRMGQRRPVHVHRLICSGTVEERIAELQARKSELAASLLEPEGAGAEGLVIDEAELDALFAPLAEG